MTFDDHNGAILSSRPSSAYSVQGLRTYSPVRVLDRIGTVSVLIAGLVLLAAANHFGWIIFH